MAAGVVGHEQRQLLGEEYLVAGPDLELAGREAVGQFDDGDRVRPALEVGRQRLVVELDQVIAETELRPADAFGVGSGL